MRSVSSTRQLRLFDALQPEAEALTREIVDPIPRDVGMVPHEAGASPDDVEARAPDVQVRRPEGESSPPAASCEPELVRHPRARRYLIRVRLDGSVRVTIPRRGSRREAMAFYTAQQSWVAAQQRRVADLRQRTPPDLDGEMERTLRTRARRELPSRLLELAAQLGLVVRKVSVRNQRRRWGSCSPSGLICLNWRLIMMPGWVRDYVLYHELMHLKRMDHSPAFWKLVAGVCPRYEEARRWLRQHGHAPHAADLQVGPALRT